MDFDLNTSIPQSADADGEYSIVAMGLTKRFGAQLAVDNVDLAVKKGEFFGFLGPNGAGKTTAIRLMCGLLRPDGGGVRLAGYELATQPLLARGCLGVLPEEPYLYERLTALEFLVFAGQMYGIPKADATARAGDLLELMELTEDRNKLIIDFSMGMKKKTALAAAIIHSPRVMFLDEPFNGIDPISVRAIRTVLRHLTERGTTIFISSHVMEVVEKLCDRIAVINHGRIVGMGAISELREQVQAGTGSTLEDIFLKMVDAREEAEELKWL
ncbi:MAG: ABC transporter ATP-binding protein [Armatimonadetes bacterium]|nr:ABC transporter ATP-binding protein [Armatimonadota bacterium]MDE2207000.1 ABC transporter ATP-binding protein [Armatimonadota bacterium]